VNLKNIFLLSLFVSPILWADSPYAPNKIGTEAGEGDLTTYTYDAAGNRIGDLQKGQTIEYGLSGKPEKITTVGENGVVEIERILYDPTGSRYLRVQHDGSRIYYVGGVEIQITPGDPEPKTIIPVHTGGYSPVAHIEVGDAVEHRYHLQDHQGSPLVTVDDAGQVIRRRHYDAWGATTDLDGTPLGMPSKQEDPSRGYTGHENIASPDLIHANGRLYDPVASGFLSADPVLFSRNLVSHNRYGGMLNSPVNYTDPSGRMPRKIRGMKLRRRLGNNLWQNGGGINLRDSTRQAELVHSESRTPFQQALAQQAGDRRIDWNYRADLPYNNSTLADARARGGLIAAERQSELFRQARVRSAPDADAMPSLKECLIK
jgi:RHS repeat-associated protein